MNMKTQFVQARKEAEHIWGRPWVYLVESKVRNMYKDGYIPEDELPNIIKMLNKGPSFWVWLRLRMWKYLTILAAVYVGYVIGTLT